MKRKIQSGNTTVKRRNRKRIFATPTTRYVPSYLSFIHTQVDILNSYFSSKETDRASAVEATKIISLLAQNERLLSEIADCGAVQALVKLLEAPPFGDDCEKTLTFEHQVEKGCAKALSLLAVVPEIQQMIVDFGAVPRLVNLLKRYKATNNSFGVRGVIRWAAMALTNIAHESDSIKKCIRIKGGIPILVELLDSNDVKIQRAALETLRTLAFRNNGNKNQIIECNALPCLTFLLQSEDIATQAEAVGVIGNLVHSSPDIKKVVLQGGALQPVLGLLRSPSLNIQKEAALMVGQFAGGDADIKVHIAQRGAVPPLLDMLHSEDDHLRETAAFSLGRLAQDKHNQAGIAHDGGLEQILLAFASTNGTLQHNAAFTLYSLADNEDNTSLFVRLAGVKLLQDAELLMTQTKDCVTRTLQRLEENMKGRVVDHLLYLMRVSNIVVQIRVVLAFAHLCSPHDQKTIFIDNNGLDLLLHLIKSEDTEQRRDGFEALYKLATKATSLLSTLSAAPLSPKTQVCLDVDYINNPTSSDVTFLVEGELFYAHRKCLLASDAFRAMLEGGFRERNVKHIKIPNITRDVFELMMRYLYTGSVDVKIGMTEDLLIAADQYLLDGLKQICECTIAQGICEDNFLEMYELSEAFNAMSLRESCIMYLLEQHDTLSTKGWYSNLIQRILPEVRDCFTSLLTKRTMQS